MTRLALGLLLTLFLAPRLPAVAASDSLEAGFRNPPDSTKPWCYWYWITDNVSKEGITRDLEAMRRVGIGEALIGHIFLEDVARGRVPALSEEWWGLVEHAIREGGRVGVNVGLFNCPGWSQSGGPWIAPTQAMRFLASSELRVRGPRKFEWQLETPRPQFQDVAVLAFPAPGRDADSLANRSFKLTTTPDLPGAGNLVDTDADTVCLFPAGVGQAGKPLMVDFDFTGPFTARSLVLHPAQRAFSLKCELQAAGEDGAFRRVREFTVDRSNTSIGVGFLPHAPVAVAFPAQTASRFRLVFTGVNGPAGLAEIELTGGARLERFIEKQLAKMHPTPLPMWDAYLWPPSAELDAPGLAIAPETVVNLTSRLAADGTLHWDVPEGEWIIQRAGLTPTGTTNAPAAPEARGYEVDKMNRAAVQAHFDAFIGKLLARMPAKDRRAFRRVVADSYEMGSQNWTDGLGALFRKRYGYDPTRWLPVLTGRVVGSADQSERFLWDLRRLVADRIAYDYVGGLRAACNAGGLSLWLENYGHWGFPSEFLLYGSQADALGGEFWATGDLGGIELRAASSAAHIYGKPVVSAEAWTSVLKFESTPWSLKKRGDWALTEGVNHWVLHVNIHQPDERRPGVNAWFSTEFNRHNTWFEQGRAFIDYYRRADFLLQQGKHAADVAYFIGEDTPKMTGTRQPPLPPGYDFDYINADVILRRLSVKGGRFTLPDGMNYRLLVLPPLDTMRPELLRKIRDLVKAGGAILGPAPARSPSMENFPACDAAVRRLAAEVWGGAGAAGAALDRPFGKGRVFQAGELQSVLDALGLPPAVSGLDARQVLWTQRTTRDAEIFFLCNQTDQPARIAPRFRVRGKAPELWDAVTGQITRTAVFEPVPDGTRVALTLEPRGSVFVVFREPLGRAPAVARVAMDGEELVSTVPVPAAGPARGAGKDRVNTFTIAGWARPEADIGLPGEADSGVFLHISRNEAVTPAHGGNLSPAGDHAGAGLAIGRNGVAVYEHSGNYFAPLLVHAAPLTGWTHVAVVYDAGQPSLYLNGQLARRGVKSRYQVHSGLSLEPGGGAGFKGDLSDWADFASALPATELARLAQTPPASARFAAAPPLVLTRGRGAALEAEVAAPGAYTLSLADGRARSLVVPTLPAAAEVDGPWEVGFPPGFDVPERIRLDALAPLHQHADEAVRHFSGTATYRAKFTGGSDVGARGTRWLLDLGRVEAMADVAVNGRELGVLWKPPFVVDVSSALRPGENTLEVRVTGTWRNRLIGAAKFPQGFPGAAGAPQFKPWLAANIGVRADEPLSPFGLIGPVRVLPVRQVVAP